MSGRVYSHTFTVPTYCPPVQWRIIRDAMYNKCVCEIMALIVEGGTLRVTYQGCTRVPDALDTAPPIAQWVHRFLVEIEWARWTHGRWRWRIAGKPLMPAP